MEQKNDYHWVSIIAVIALAITTIPYWLGFTRQTQDWVFSGFVFGVEDGNSYAAKMLAGANGDWLFRTPYTATPQTGFLAFLPYILLGKLTSTPGQHEQIIALFQVFRWVAGICLCFATYDFLSLFLKNKKFKRLALLLILFGGGLGWLVFLGIQSQGYHGLPLEFYSPETFGFLSFFGLPHLALARAFLLWGFYWLFKENEPIRSYRNAIISGFFWFAIGFIQPLTTATGWMILAGFILVGLIAILVNRSDRRAKLISDWMVWFKRIVIVGLISSPMVIYTIYAFNTDAYLKGWAKQNIILSPPIFDYFLAFGLFLPFAILGAVRLMRIERILGVFMAGWLILFPILAYFPNNLQRRLPDGIWVILVIAAFVFFEAIQAKWIRILLPIVSTSFLTSLIFFAGSIASVETLQQPVFLPRAEVNLFTKIVPPGVVLANFDVSNALPAWSPIHTVIGHGPESIGLAELQPVVDQILSGKVGYPERTKWLQAMQINYILTSPEESQSLINLDLQLIEQAGGYSLYKFLPANTP